MSRGNIINITNEASNSVEIANEKQIIQMATAVAEHSKKAEMVTENEMQIAIDNVTEKSEAKVIEDYDSMYIQFNISNRCYKIDINGNIEGPIEIKKDETPGALDGTGTKEDPLVIMSIEDLVYFSKSVSYEGAYKSQYVKLGRTLDFMSKLSYVDYTTTVYDNYLGGDGSTELMEQLCYGEGFRSIGRTNGNWCFSGIFDGNGNEIKNIRGESLFCNILNATIKDIIVSGKIDYKNSSGGGIINKATQSYIYNCHSNIEVRGCSVAGICSWSVDSKFVNCYNTGEIYGKWTTCAGGIVGESEGENVICNSYNLADVEMYNGNSYCCAAGIMACIRNGSVKIFNCYNIGKVTSSRYSGGIYANPDSTVELQNCYYLDTTAPSKGAIAVTNMQIKNNEKLEDKYLIDILNNNVKTYNLQNINQPDFIELKTWCVGENGYPAFEYVNN